MNTSFPTIIFLGYKALPDHVTCVESDAKQCDVFTLEMCKETFGYESNYEVCKSNGKDYQHFQKYCDYAQNICNETASSWATVKMGACDFKFE